MTFGPSARIFSTALAGALLSVSASVAHAQDCSANDSYDRLQGVIAEQLAVSADDVKFGASLRGDLGASDESLTGLMEAVNSEFCTSMSDASEMTTFDDLVEAIERHYGG